MPYEVNKTYTTEDGIWYLQNEQDLFFQVSLPEGDVEGLFWWDEDRVALGNWRYAADETDCFDDLGDQVSDAKLDELEAKWRPLAERVLTELNLKVESGSR